MDQAENTPTNNKQPMDIGNIVMQNAAYFTHNICSWNANNSDDKTQVKFQKRFSSAQRKLELAKTTARSMVYNQENIAQQTTKIVIENLQQAPILQPSYYNP